MVVIKNCPNLSTSHYADGRIVENECSLEEDKLCQECNTCLIKTVYMKQLAFYNGCLSEFGKNPIKEILDLFNASGGKEEEDDSNISV